jgi:hypothetical protein
LLFDLLYKLLHFLRFVFLQSEGVQDRFRALTFFKPKVLSTLAFDEATLGCSFFFGGMAKTRLFVGSQLSRSKNANLVQLDKLLAAAPSFRPFSFFYNLAFSVLFAIASFNISFGLSPLTISGDR